MVEFVGVYFNFLALTECVIDSSVNDILFAPVLKTKVKINCNRTIVV